MCDISHKARQLFKEWGKFGGERRAKKLSPRERSAIAAAASRARWNTVQPFQSIRLQDPRLNDPVFLEELLSDGTWNDWKRLYQDISDRPFGNASIALEKVCSFAKMYGISNLWKGILRTVRGVAT